MTAYYVTLGVVAYFLVLAESTNRLEPAGIGETPSRSTSSRLFLFFATAALILVAGLRWRVGTDYGGYARNYELYKQSFLTDFLSFNEPGAKGLALVASWIRDDYATFIFLASVVTVGLMLWTITKYSPTVAFSVSLFVLAGLWHGSFNGVRQYLACAIVFAGHRYIVDRKPLRYALIVSIGSLFHISALAMAVVYFLPRRRLTAYEVATTIAVSVAALYSADLVLGLVETVKGEELTTVYVTSAINPSRIAVAVAPLALYALQRKPDEDRPEDWFYRNMAIVHAAVMITVSWSAYLGRFGIFTTAFIPLVLPLLVSFRDKSLTALARFVVLALFAVFWYVDVSKSPALNNFSWIFERMS